MILDLDMLDFENYTLLYTGYFTFNEYNHTFTYPKAEIELIHKRK